MKKVTNQQKAKLQKLDDAVNMATNSIFNCGSNRHTVFSECFKLADDNLRKAYNSAIYEKAKFETELIADGRGWRNAFGHFYSY